MPLLIVGAIGLVALVAGAAAAIMIVLMNRGAVSPSDLPTDAPPAADAPVSPPPPAESAPLEAPPVAPPDTPAPESPANADAVPDGIASPAARARDRERARQAAPPDREATTEREPRARAQEKDDEPVERAIRVGGQIQPPRKTRNVQPVYPRIAQSARVQGVVIIEATVDREGRVTDTRLLRSIPLLDEAALDAVRQWEYEPTRLNGETVPVIMTVTVKFSLGR